MAPSTASAIIVDGSAAYDLFLSLAALAAPAMFPRWRPWATETLRTYNEREQQRVRRWFGGRWALGRAFSSILPLVPEPRGVPEVLRTLTDLPVADFLRIVVTIGYVNPETPLDADHLIRLCRDAREARSFVEQYLRLSGKAWTHVLGVLSDPEGARADLLATLRHHGQRATYRDLVAATQDERDRATDVLRAVAASGPTALTTVAPESVPIAEFTPVVLAPSVVLDGRISQYYQEIARSLLDGAAYEPLIVMIGTRRALGETLPRKRSPLMADPATTPIERAAGVFGLLADPSRLRLLRLLAERPYYGQEVGVALGMTGATVSHHVTLLTTAGVVGIERRGHRTYYVLRAEALAALLRGSARDVLRLLSVTDDERAVR